MNIKKVYFYSGILLSMSNASAMQINQATMQQASQELTIKEAQTLKDYLYMRIEQLKREAPTDLVLQEKAAFEKVVTLFFQHHYDKVLKNLSELGYNPQEILHSSALRTAMLSGDLEQKPWFLREIAGLDWFFERDARRRQKKWPKPQNKLIYITSLIDQLERNYTKVFDAALIRDAIDALERQLMILAGTSSKTLKIRFTDLHTRLEAIRAELNGSQPATLK